MLYVVENKKPYDKVVATARTVRDALLLARDADKVIGAAKGDHYIDRDSHLLDPRRPCDWLVTGEQGTVCDVPAYGSHEYYHAIYARDPETERTERAERMASLEERRERRRRGQRPAAYRLASHRHTTSVAHNMRACICDDDVRDVRCAARPKGLPDRAPWKSISKCWKDQDKRPSQWRVVASCT